MQFFGCLGVVIQMFLAVIIKSSATCYTLYTLQSAVCSLCTCIVLLCLCGLYKRYYIDYLFKICVYSCISIYLICKVRSVQYLHRFYFLVHHVTLLTLHSQISYQHSEIPLSFPLGTKFLYVLLSALITKFDTPFLLL